MTSCIDYRLVTWFKPKPKQTRKQPYHELHATLHLSDLIDDTRTTADLCKYTRLFFSFSLLLSTFASLLPNSKISLYPLAKNIPNVVCFPRRKLKLRKQNNLRFNHTIIFLYFVSVCARVIFLSSLFLSSNHQHCLSNFSPSTIYSTIHIYCHSLEKPTLVYVRSFTQFPSHAYRRFFVFV